MKVLITGSGGFIGSHLAEELISGGHKVVKCNLSGSEDMVPMDIMSQEMIQNVLEECKPDVIINMAGQANVELSWKRPQFTVQLNTIGLINILEAVKAVDKCIKVIAVGSSDEYGSLKGSGTDVTEKIPVNPITPYAISKVAQELFAQLYIRSYRMNICMIRLFNLGGPGQAKGYLISDFSSGIAEIEAGIRNHMLVGNLTSARDFTHVKDACRAVRLVAEKGRIGEVYNICSGVTYTAQEVLDKLIGMSNTRVEVKQDPAKMRPSDTPVICGNHEKISLHTGWQPERGIDVILSDALDYWRWQLQG